MVVDAVGVGHAQLAAAVGGAQELDILAAEHLRERRRGEQESPARRGQPLLPVRTQSPVGDDAVDMDVLTQILPPSMKHHGDAELAAEPAGIAAELEQGLRRRLEQQPVDEGRMALGDSIELMGQGEHDMPVRDIEELCALALDPSGLCQGLALGAVTIPARCVLNRHRPAVVAVRLESAQSSGTAAHSAFTTRSFWADSRCVSR